MKLIELASSGDVAIDSDGSPSRVILHTNSGLIESPVVIFRKGDSESPLWEKERKIPDPDGTGLGKGDRPSCLAQDYGTPGSPERVGLVE